MRILWLIGTRDQALGPSADWRALARSPMASDRLRIAIPAAALATHGVQSEFCVLAPQAPLPDPARYDALVIGKFSSPAFADAARSELWARFVERALGARRRVVVDVSDNPFAGIDSRAALYEKLLAACTAVSVPSQAMARLIAARLGVLAKLVRDPYEGEPLPPRFAPGEGLRVLWFGHAQNLSYLQPLAPRLVELARERPVELEVVTGEVKGIERALDALRSGDFHARYTRWSFDAMRKAFASCDLVLIPSDPADPRKNGASTNRLVETLVAGRLPVASPLETYLPFENYALIRADLAGGLREALRDPAAMQKRVQAGQGIVLEQHAPEAVARDWLAVLAA